MIFYFSGTGNSLAVAKSIAKALQTELRSIAKELERPSAEMHYSWEKDELFGLVYPVHAWGPPAIVLDFIHKLTLSGKQPYLFSIATCGGEEGLSCEIIQKAMKKKKAIIDASFTIVMPNNYLLGVNVDSKQVEEDKLRQASQQVQHIHHILKNKQQGIFEIYKGSMPRFKSTIINPLFNRFSMSTKHFYATDACIQCKICEQVCPIHSIVVSEKPLWSKACTHCMACINSCPQKAIEYGKSTKGRDRYLHPELKQELWG